MELIVVDHHPHASAGKAIVPKVETPHQFYEQARKYLEQDCDIIVTDADPDGLLSAVIYRIGFNSIAPIQFVGEINQELLAEFNNRGIKRILSLDIGKWYAHFDKFSHVVLLNPSHSGLLLEINTSEILYQSCLRKTDYLRDLNALAIVADYTIEDAMETIAEVVNAYPELLHDVKKLIDEDRLDRDSVMHTALARLADAVWAGTIIDGRHGALHLIDLLLQNPFTLDELSSGAGTPAVQQLKSAYQRFAKLIKEELAQQPETLGKLLICEVRKDPPGIGRFVATRLAEMNPDKIVVVKQRSDKGWKYSIRRVLSDINLGKIVAKLGFGGGHPRAAGAFAANGKDFESQLMRAVESH